MNSLNWPLTKKAQAIWPDATVRTQAPQGNQESGDWWLYRGETPHLNLGNRYRMAHAQLDTLKRAMTASEVGQ